MPNSQLTARQQRNDEISYERIVSAIEALLAKKRRDYERALRLETRGFCERLRSEIVEWEQDLARVKDHAMR